jgi:hypothetical protein
LYLKPVNFTETNHDENRRDEMVEAFGGSLNLGLFILTLAGGAYYGYRCLFASKAFVDQYGFGDGAIFMTRFAGSCVGASVIVGVVVLLVGPQGAWPIVAFGFVQSLIATIFGYMTINSEWAKTEGVSATPEGYLAPLGFAIVNCILMFNMSDILYG